MKVVYPKALTEKELEKVAIISERCGILNETARLLYYRGITDENAAKRFLNPGKKHFLNPFALNGILKAVERITFARDLGQSVLVFGDYDADGICAATVLSGCLKIFGVKPIVAIPEREEGYGINLAKIESIREKQNVDLIITVDCGISDGDKIAALKNLGIDVIVSDHHEPPENLPDCICINPKIKGQNYGFDGLCGGGVAYKIGYALIGEKADEFLDLVALATVADSMDLVGENRDLVAEGLKLINHKPKEAFRAFLGDGQKEITAQTLAYAVAPRINAGGRMGDAASALKLFCEEDKNEIFDLSVKLNVYNAERQSLCEQAFSEAKELIFKTGANADGIILVKNEKWNAGILGIVAAKLTEIFNKPVIVMGKCGDLYKGSARSVENVNIYEAILSARDLLAAFGGHSQAAGLSVKKENFQALKIALNEYAKKHFKSAETEKTVFADFAIVEAVPLRLAEEIEMLEPFGVGNRRPLFTTSVGRVETAPLKEGSPHYTFSTEAVQMLDFNGEKDVETLAYPVNKTLIFELNLSTFRNKRSLKGFLRDIVCDFGDFGAFSVPVFYREITSVVAEKEIPVMPFSVEDGYGTAYVVSDVRSLKKVKDFGIKIYPYRTGDNSGKNCIILSPDYIPEEYNNVVYLDRPLWRRDFGGRAKIADRPICNVADGLSIERTDFETAFSLAVSGLGREFEKFTEYCLNGKTEAEQRQFLFCFAVFCELGFFTVKNGVVVRNAGVKKPLNDSVIYRKVGELC